MRVVTRDFLNDNEYRAYPLDDKASYEPYAAEDVEAVNSLLTDIRLVLPKAQAAVAFIANITITKLLITVTIMGSKEHPFSPNTPAATANNAEYLALGATVLGRVQVKRALAQPGAVVPITPAIPGVGGWIVFGSGVLKEGSWSFNGPAAAMISDQCVTRYDYGGVFSVGQLGFDTTISGRVNLVGQGGVEVVSDDKGSAIQFSGLSQQVKQGLNTYVGNCGGRPESDTCLFSAIKTINGIVPAGIAGDIVLVLDKPLYATLRGADDKETLTIGSDIKLEAFCKTRLQIPDNCASGSNPLTANFLQSSNSPTNQVSIDPNIVLTVDVSDGVTYGYSNFKYSQQHPNRPTVAMYTAVNPLPVLGEYLSSLQVDIGLNEWQLYGSDGPSMNAYGTLTNNLRGNRIVSYGGIEYKISLGPATLFDLLEYSTIKVAIDAPDQFEEAGTYVRKSYGVYEHTADPSYTLEVRGFLDSVWAILKNGVLLAAGPINTNGTGTNIQNYTRPDGKSAVRAIGVTGA